jgi:hypothetical protein
MKTLILAVMLSIGTVSVAVIQAKPAAAGGGTNVGGLGNGQNYDG